MIKRIAEKVSKSDGLMSLYFTLEIGFFIFTGFSLCLISFVNDINLLLFVAGLSFSSGLSNAFIVGEAIRIKERRAING